MVRGLPSLTVLYAVTIVPNNVLESEIDDARPWRGRSRL